jgi:hypothetical protein
MPCDRPLLYKNDLWSIIITPDQLGCNRYLWSIYDQVVGARILHIGTGASTIFHAFRDEAERIDGITIVPSEIAVGANLAGCYKKEYRIWNFNKYDCASFDAFNVPRDYDFIVDNNLKQHACCNDHWREYFNTIASRLSPGGQLITHTQGFCRFTGVKTDVEALTVEELRDLCTMHPANLALECRSELKNRAAHYPVVIRRNGSKS